MTDSIAETLTADHRRCDGLLALVESVIDGGDRDFIASRARDPGQPMEAHSGFEEETLFPPLEAAVPMASGPTGVMRGEHHQMRRLLTELAEATRARDAGECLGLPETPHPVVQQHNAKEEAILYPMAEEALGAVPPDLVARFPG